MDWMLFAAGFFAVLGALCALVRHVQILQQSSYYPSRYSGWLRTAFGANAVFSLFVMAILIALLFLSPLACLIAAAISLPFRLIRAVKLQKSAIKKLVVTARVKRLFLAVAIFLAIFLALAAWLDSKILYAVLYAVCFAQPLLTLCGWGLTLPIEKAIARHYKNDAKQILREHKDLTVIGVTGSYGKTSTKFILARLLEEGFNVVATPESFNTPMGVVRTVREKLRPQTQIFICEMGAKNVGDIREICEIADPSIGIITSVGPQHLETFGSIEQVAKTKFELADWVLGKNGSAFVNGDNEIIRQRTMAPGFQRYGTDATFPYYAANIRYHAGGSAFDLILDGERVPVETKLLGMHNVLNITAAAAVAHTLGIEADAIRYAVSQLTATPHRLELKRFLAGSTLIDDAYNANPEGCLEAVRVLGAFDGMKKVIVTPGLVELGEKEYEANYALGLAAAKVCDTIILVGQKRSVPLADAIKTTPFPAEALHIVDRFADAMEVLTELADLKTVILFENDLPDNYAG